jgi:hypothetical protein
MLIVTFPETLMFEMVVVVTVSEYGIVPFSTPLINNLKLPFVPENLSCVVTVKFPIPPEIGEELNLPFLTVIALLLIVWSDLESVAVHVIPVLVQFMVS